MNATPTPLTAQQKRVLDFIREYQAEHGYAPTVRDIGQKLGIVSPNGVLCHLKALQKKGYLTRDRNVSRGIVSLNRSPNDALDGITKSLERLKPAEASWVARKIHDRFVIDEPTA